LLAIERPNRSKLERLPGGCQHFFGFENHFAVGYCSYEWAKVLDADAFPKTKEDGSAQSNK
jgi:Zn-dependent oligopeptidase